MVSMLKQQIAKFLATPEYWPKWLWRSSGANASKYAPEVIPFLPEIEKLVTEAEILQRLHQTKVKKLFISSDFWSPLYQYTKEIRGTAPDFCYGGVTFKGMCVEIDLGLEEEKGVKWLITNSWKEQEEVENKLAANLYLGAFLKH